MATTVGSNTDREAEAASSGLVAAAGTIGAQPAVAPPDQESQSQSQTRDATTVAGTTSTTAAPNLHNPIPSDIQSSPVSSPIEEGTRNQAPGILDRRKSTKPDSRLGSRNRRGGAGGLASKRAGGPPIRVTMADTPSDQKAKDGDRTPGTPEEEETFEDAQLESSTPRQETTNGDGGAAGLAMDGAAETAQSTLETKDGQVNDINGGDAASDSKPTHSRQATLDNIPDLPPPGEGSMSPGKTPSGRQSPSKQHLHGLSGDFAVSTPPPPSTADRHRSLEQRQLGERPSLSPNPQGENLAKKASSGFGALLGRMGSIRKARSPPARSERFAGARRNTGASTASVDGHTNGLASIVDGPEGVAKPSLQDQFKSLRQHEEYAMNGGGPDGNAANGEDGDKTPIVRTKSDFGVPASTIMEEGEEAKSPGPDRSSSTPGLLLSPGGLKSPPLNPSLPPGTASGLSAGPADEPRPVNWDLWQALVNEGPAAVKRTSGEELQAAIASGIPPAIRGVVWQVLADSKNEELEAIYHSLKARGTDADQPVKPPPMSRSESQSAINGIASEKDHSVPSSRSSVNSEKTTPATSAMVSPAPSTATAGDPIDLQTRLIAEKQKREAENLAKLEKSIKRDMGARTSYSKFASSAGLQDGLFGVCKAYALYDEGVGYAQGINFIAMPLLFLTSEEEAFSLLVKLMSRYDVRSMFTPEMAGLHLRLYQYERLLEDLEPALYCHLKRRHVAPQLYATQWFLTLFAYRFPLQLVLRVYDLIFSEGLTSAILKFGIVLMQRNRETLLGMRDMAQLSSFLKERLFDVYIDKSPSASSLLETGFFGSVSGGADKELYRADEMVRDACDVQVTEELLASYTGEWEEQQRVDRLRTEELETLRASNTSLTSRLKSLEERTQQQDTEHVAIAGELVNLKLQNDTLNDENEGMKMKVEELQRIADAQPAEVEERLKDEMERILQRNSEVQDENRGLKEEVEELGSQLVQSKMSHAQARSDHDALQQRFANVQAAING